METGNNPMAKLAEELKRFDESVFPLIVKHPEQMNTIATLIWEFNIQVNNILIGKTEEAPESLVKDISAPVSRLINRFCEMILSALDNEEDISKIDTLATTLKILNEEIEKIAPSYQKWVESITQTRGASRTVLEYFGKFPIGTEISRKQIVKGLGITSKEEFIKMNSALYRLSTRTPSQDEKFLFKGIRFGVYKVTERQTEDADVSRISEIDDKTKITPEMIEHAIVWANANSEPDTAINKIMVFLAKSLGKETTIDQIAETTQLTKRSAAKHLSELKLKKCPNSPYDLKCYGRHNETYILNPRTGIKTVNKPYNAEDIVAATDWVETNFGKTKVQLYFMLILANNLGRYVPISEIRAVDPEITKQNLCVYISKLRIKLAKEHSPYQIETTYGQYRLIKVY